MSMAQTHQETRALSKDELLRLRDASAEHTMVGLNHYQTEIERREAAEQAERMEAMTSEMTLLTREMAELNRKITGLTVGMYWMSAVAIALALATYVLSVIGVI